MKEYFGEFLISTREAEVEKYTIACRSFAQFVLRAAFDTRLKRQQQPGEYIVVVEFLAEDKTPHGIIVRQ